ncbi:MAG: dephospho-CoA kinase [Acidimicrobiia bacterium]
MKVIGLAGGIGSGKSTVSLLLAARGAVILDGDKIARELQEPGQGVFLAMVGRWGPDIVNPDGTLNRQAMADIAFTDPDQLAALTAITRPAIEATLLERIEEREGTDDVVILDVALLVQAHQYGEQATIVVDVPVDVAVERLVASRGMGEADARARIAAQITREERKAFADFVIDNAGDEADLAPQVDAAWAWIEGLPHR